MKNTSKSLHPHGAYYYVYDLRTDTLIASGTIYSICKRLDITKSCVSKALRHNDGYLKWGKWRIYYEDDDRER